MEPFCFERESRVFQDQGDEIAESELRGIEPDLPAIARLMSRRSATSWLCALALRSMTPARGSESARAVNHSGADAPSR